MASGFFLGGVAEGASSGFTRVSDVLLKACTDLPAQTVPAAAVALTAGIDMQKYGVCAVKQSPTGENEDRQ